MNTAIPCPEGHKRLRAVKAFTFAHQEFGVGATLIVSDDAADQLLKERKVIAIEVPAKGIAETTACATCGQPVHPVCGHVAVR